MAVQDIHMTWDTILSERTAYVQDMTYGSLVWQLSVRQHEELKELMVAKVTCMQDLRDVPEHARGHVTDVHIRVLHCNVKVNNLTFEYEIVDGVPSVQNPTTEDGQSTPTISVSEGVEDGIENVKVDCPTVDPSKHPGDKNWQIPLDDQQLRVSIEHLVAPKFAVEVGESPCLIL